MAHYDPKIFFKVVMFYISLFTIGKFSMYLLSNETVDSLITNEKIELISKEYLEDYAIGYYLPEEFKKTIMFIDTNVYFKDFI